MQILNASQVKAWDQFTIENEPVSSIDLMERAASLCVEWIQMQPWNQRSFHIFCGKGNNGGDGLAIARMLLRSGYKVLVYIPDTGKNGTPDFEQNLQRLKKTSGAGIKLVLQESDFPLLKMEDIVVDALFGIGLSQPPAGIYASLIQHINQSRTEVLSIDLPSGLFPDASSKHKEIIRAAHTLSFQCYKLGFLLAENAPFIGELHILDIGLLPSFTEQLRTEYQFIDQHLARAIYRPRNRFAHKGMFGHALLIGGSYGKMGAMVLATKACMRSGAGLTTAFIPRCGYHILQTTLPEAMVLTSENDEYISSLPEDIERYAAIGVGPGTGTKDDTAKMISFIVRRYTKPLVIDADGLNCLSQQRELYHQLPSCSILTPHPKEFDRLFDQQPDDLSRILKAREKARALNVVIVLKGHHTLIATPGGMCYFNTTGNAGMAKGGSGDVLTGILTALLSQGYSPEQAALFGVYLHGLAGDLAAARLSQEAMLPGDLIAFLPEAFQSIHKK